MKRLCFNILFISLILLFLPMTRHLLMAAEQQNVEFNKGIAAEIDGNFDEARNRLIVLLEFRRTII